jgi:hypothetical protein
MQDNTLVLIAVFTGIAAFALVLQSAAFLAIARSMRSMSVRVDRLGTDLTKQMVSVSGKTEELLAVIKGVAEGIKTIESNLTATSAIIQKRVVELDAFLEETADAARLQVLRIQGVVENVSSKVEETFELLQHGVIAPANELTAIIRGIRVGLDFLRKRKQPASTSHLDEEMFI